MNRLGINLDDINKFNSSYMLIEKELKKLLPFFKEILDDVYNNSDIINKSLIPAYSQDFNSVILFVDINNYEYNYNFFSIYEEVVNTYYQQFPEFLEENKREKNKISLYPLITIDFQKEIIDINIPKANTLNEFNRRVWEECKDAIKYLEDCKNSFQDYFEYLYYKPIVFFRKRKINKIKKEIDFVSKQLNKAYKNSKNAESYYYFCNEGLLDRFCNSLKELLKYKLNGDFRITKNFFKTFDIKKSYFKFEYDIERIGGNKK